MTEHFSLNDFTISHTALRLGVDNTPPAGIIKNLENTAKKLELIRFLIGCPIIVLSGYRSDKLNFAIGGRPNSQHLTGEAVDIIAPRYGSPYDLAKRISENAASLNFDQLILEFDKWVHVSFNATPRNEVITIQSKNVGYLKGLLKS